MNAIEISHINMRYQMLQALDDVSMNVKQDEFFGLLGSNGAGKTTLFSIMAGLVFADSGSVHIMGGDVIQDYRMTRRMLGVVSQEIVFDPFFYLVDGFRYGFFGHSDVNPWTSLMIVSIFFCFFAVFTLHLLRKGYKLRF